MAVNKLCVECQERENAAVDFRLKCEFCYAPIHVNCAWYVYGVLPARYGTARLCAECAEGNE